MLVAGEDQKRTRVHMEWNEWTGEEEPALLPG